MWLIPLVQDIRYEADQLVFKQGTARSAFLVVKEGEAQLTVRHCDDQ